MFDTVVVGATDSDGARRAFDRALELAGATGGTLHVVTAIPRKGEPPPYLPEEFRYTDAGADGPDWLLG
jgi:nucleotide-binding universal stress UspA family protein